MKKKGKKSLEIFSEVEEVTKNRLDCSGVARFENLAWLSHASSMHVVVINEMGVLCVCTGCFADRYQSRMIKNPKYS